MILNTVKVNAEIKSNYRAQNHMSTAIIHWETSLNEYKKVNVMQGIKLLTVPCFYQETSPENSNTFTNVSIQTYICFKGLKQNVEICRDRSDVSSSSVCCPSETFTDTEMCVYLVFLEQLFDADFRQVRRIVRRSRSDSLTVILKLHVSRGHCAWSIMLYKSQRVLHTQTHHRSNLCASNLLRTALEWEITYQISSVSQLFLLNRRGQIKTCFSLDYWSLFLMCLL